jgi:hypothetical protein
MIDAVMKAEEANEDIKCDGERKRKKKSLTTMEVFI